MKKVVFTVLVSVLAFVALNATAQPTPSPEDIAKQAVDVRRSVKKLINWNNQTFGNLLRKRTEYDAGAVELAATRISQLAAMLPDVFAQDTSEFDNLDTRALDGIWASKNDFDSKAKNLSERAKALAELATTGSEQEVMAALRSFGRDTCGDCHDTYRYKD